jgi:lysosomal Pro-X carboxypeptidase
MWENAAAAGAYIVFAEHRYYGQSQPFGSASSLWLEYLTHEQALADYAAIIFALQAELGAGAQPVVVFGGSYGGKLAAWMRLKYPGAVAGAVAASAPVLFFEGTSPDPGDFEQFWRVVTRDMTPAAGAAAACAPNVRAAWDAIDAAAAQDMPRLSALFQLCAPLASAADVFALKIMHLNAWDSCAMGNYPCVVARARPALRAPPLSFYPSLSPSLSHTHGHSPPAARRCTCRYASNYLTGNGPLLPAFPVRAMCAQLANATLASDPWALLAAFNAAGSVFNNATQNIECYVLPTDLYLDGIWDYRAWRRGRVRRACHARALPFTHPPPPGTAPTFARRARVLHRDAARGDVL